MFVSTRRKIALFFSLFASVLLITITMLTIGVIRFSIENQAKQTLQVALKSVISDYNTNQLENKSFAFQMRNSVSFSESKTGISLPNVKDKAVVSDEILNQKLAKNETSLSSLQQQKNVYSRVILSDGSILFTSDLFEQYNLDITQKGFATINVGQLCIHAITTSVSSGTNAGSIVQVGQYCPFPDYQQRLLFMQLLVLTGVLVFVTYFIGLGISGIFFKPLIQSMKKTRQFVENAYHELLTPVSVALTTIDATLVTQNYQEGIESLQQDLHSIKESLHVLSRQSLEYQKQISTEPININEAIRNEIKLFSHKFAMEHFTLTVNGDDRIFQKIDSTAFKIIMTNLLSNIRKYADSDVPVIFNVSRSGITIKNGVKDLSIEQKRLFERGYTLDTSGKSKGIGLALVKDICEEYGWKINAKNMNNSLELVIQFGMSNNV
ncbi:MAG: HAMP domain-containing sensor histidine kinase [Candidatus Roizmanbacteria bacterium]